MKVSIGRMMKTGISKTVSRQTILASGMLAAFLACHLPAASLSSERTRCRQTHELAESISDSISGIVSGAPGKIGVAVIINGIDTVAVNDDNIYPLMSVFKVHQALAICGRCDRDGIPLDSMLTIHKDELDPTTWSPMREEYNGQSFSLSIRGLLQYSLVQSDNNASNILFERLVNVEETDMFISKWIPRSCFRLTYKESDMAADHSRASFNRTSPLGAATLMDRLFSETLVSHEKQDFIMKCLHECATGKDRISAPLIGRPGLTIAHKTGSGYTDNGLLSACNDVAYITLPNGLHYTLSVFVRDFRGTEAEASQIAARISATVYSSLTQCPALKTAGTGTKKAPELSGA